MFELLKLSKVRIPLNSYGSTADNGDGPFMDGRTDRYYKSEGSMDRTSLSASYSPASYIFLRNPQGHCGSGG